MKVAVRYYTKTGNTKRLAEAVAKAVGVEAINSGYVIKPYNYFREFVARGKDLVFTIIKPESDFIGSVL